MPEQGEVSELEGNSVVQSHKNDPEDVQSQLADEPTAVPEGNVFEEPQDMGVPLGHLSHDHSKNLSHPGKISNLGYFIISDQSILSQGGAQPQLFSAVVLPAPCPVYPSQSQFPAHGGGYSFCVYPCAITTPSGKLLLVLSFPRADGHFPGTLSCPGVRCDEIGRAHV